MSRQPGLAPVREVLTQNPGIKWDQSQWPTIAYKGGSEAGVLYTAWLMERHDGRSFVMCFGINDSASALNTGSIIKTLKACGALLAQFE